MAKQKSATRVRLESARDLIIEPFNITKHGEKSYNNIMNIWRSKNHGIVKKAIALPIELSIVPGDFLYSLVSNTFLNSHKLITGDTNLQNKTKESYEALGGFFTTCIQAGLFIFGIMKLANRYNHLKFFNAICKHNAIAYAIGGAICLVFLEQSKNKYQGPILETTAIATFGAAFMLLTYGIQQKVLPKMLFGKNPGTVMNYLLAFTVTLMSFIGAVLTVDKVEKYLEQKKQSPGNSLQP